jgi:hypothetical protein
MNIDKLIAAAKEIDCLYIRHQEYIKDMEQLSREARLAKTKKEREEIRVKHSLQMKLQVFDYGDAIAKLRRALRAKPSKK